MQKQQVVTFSLLDANNVNFIALSLATRIITMTVVYTYVATTKRGTAGMMHYLLLANKEPLFNLVC